MEYKSSWDYFGVKIIKQILVEDMPDPACLDELYKEDGIQCFEESVLLVHAQSINHAHKIARKMSEEGEVAYLNSYGQQVTWKLMDIVDCFQIVDKLGSGAEVYSCLHSTDDSAKNFMAKWFSHTDKL